MQKPNPHFLIGLIPIFLFSLLCFNHKTFSQDKNKGSERDTEQRPGGRDSLYRTDYEVELDKNWSFGFQHYRSKQYTEVPRYFWRVIEMDTIAVSPTATGKAGVSAVTRANCRKFPQVFDFLGQTYLQLNKPDSAELVYALGVRTFPHAANLRHHLAALLEARAQFDSALAQYERIITLGAATEDDYRRLVNLYIHAKQYDQAIAACEKILVLSPNDTETRNTLSTLYKATAREDAVIDNMEKALAQNPNDARIMYELAQARFNRQEYEKVVELLPRFVKLVSNDFFALELFADAQARLGRHREALQTYAQIIAARPEAKNVLVKMSDCHRALGEFPAARRFANKALAIDSQCGAAYLALGQVYQTCADQCVAQKGKIEYDDKLVYELAYFQYERALQDSTTRNESRQRLNSLAASIPQKEDRFRNKGKDKATGSCYQWIY
ncbi:MAG: tetratricopeptide repeat protein [candidate division KSB1 bacterium]|nr:tetratricopeptide repeat protein [candidate division KSB1 bacterium]MDZ7301340.1 tetratricopeptide repeat protein [candidate division KSB1 bacterium]MDZ7310775.1 tetratricopeptide repeat protein [candidate division KSB1 bacterium]